MHADAATLTLTRKIVIKTSNDTSALSATKAPNTSIVAISNAEPKIKTNRDVGFELILEMDCSKYLDV
jgi:hypothetical protein